MAKVVLWTIVNSARGLRDVRLLGNMKVYAEISLSNDPNSTQKTPVDTKGETKPSWNFKTKFIFDAPLLQDQTMELIFELKCQRTLGDKPVGEVRISLQELLRKAVRYPLGFIQLVTYPVKGLKGSKHGSLTFSYSFAKAVTHANTGGRSGSPSQEQLNSYALRLQELGLAVGVASLAEKLYEASEDDPSGELGESSNADLTDIDPSVGLQEENNVENHQNMGWDPTLEFGLQDPTGFETYDSLYGGDQSVMVDQAAFMGDPLFVDQSMVPDASSSVSVPDTSSSVDVSGFF